MQEASVPDHQVKSISDMFLRRFCSDVRTRDLAALAAARVVLGLPLPPVPEGIKPCPWTKDGAFAVATLILGYYMKDGAGNAEKAAKAAVSILFTPDPASVVPEVKKAPVEPLAPPEGIPPVIRPDPPVKRRGRPLGSKNHARA